VLNPPRLVGVALIFQTMFFVASLVSFRYLDVDILSSISDKARDTHCARGGGEGLGVHCFGDYFQVATLVREGTVWSSDGASNYPPTALLPFLGGLLPESLLRAVPNLGLYFFLFLVFAGFVAVALWATQGKSIAEKLLAVVVVGPFAAPALVALDRGNSAGLLAAPLLLFAVGFLRNKPAAMMAGALIAAMIKPQFVVLFLALLLARRYGHLVVGLLALAATNLLGFVLDFQHFPQNVISWSGSIIDYSSESPGYSPEGTHPPNQSIVRGLDLLSFERTPWLWLVGAFIIGAFLVVTVLSIRGIVVDRASILVFLFVLGSLGPPTAWMYYLVFAQVLLALHWRGVLLPLKPDRGDSVLTSDSPSVAERLSLFLGILGSVAVVVIPSAADAHLNQPLTSWNFLPTVWVVWFGAFAFRLFVTVAGKGPAWGRSASLGNFWPRAEQLKWPRTRRELPNDGSESSEGR
jgi:hypothetical protein